MTTKYLRPLALTVVACVSAVGATSASAAVLPSLNRATFQAAISGSTTLGVQNFDSLAAGTILTTLSGVTYAASGGQPIVTNNYLTSTTPNGLGSTSVGYFTASETATFTFSSAITAFAIDINTFATANGSYLATLNTGDTANSIFETFPGAGTGQFIGFTSPTAFTSVTISSTGTFPYTLDTLIYGSREAVTGAVPEPATWALMIIGFGAAGTAMRRRQKVRVSFA